MSSKNIWNTKNSVLRYANSTHKYTISVKSANTLADTVVKSLSFKFLKYKYCIKKQNKEIQQRIIIWHPMPFLSDAVFRNSQFSNGYWCWPAFQARTVYMSVLNICLLAIVATINIWIKTA